MNQKDYYKTLGVGEDAGPGEIKKAYRNLAFRYHPDRNPGGEEMMKAINEAYAVLSNPVKKKEYDALRQAYGPFARDQFRQSHTDQDIFRGSDIGQVFEEFSKAFGFSRPEDIFSRNNFYGSRYRTFEFKDPGFSGSGFYFYGPMRKIYQDRLKTSPDQMRQLHPLLSVIIARILDFFTGLAARRLGLELPTRGKDLYDVIGIARKEAVAGGKVRYLYKKRGQPRDLLITVPPGIRDGQKIKLKGLGQEGKKGGEPGDLFLRAKIRTSFLERIKEFFKQ